MRKVALRLAYDGTRFAGSQWQRTGRTVQAELESAWTRLAQERVRAVFAGRTDAGVHAQGQVAHIETVTSHPAATIQRALNALLPDDLVVLEGWDAEPDFHARFSARWRSYRYLIDPARVPLPQLRHYVLHHPATLDVAAMQAALQMLEGEHDFAAFAALHGYTGSTTRHCWRATSQWVTWYGRDLFAVDLVANGFLRHMVRNIVGTVLLVGRRHLTLSGFGQVFQSRDRQQAGPTAAAHGLTLMAVGYTHVTLPDVVGAKLGETRQ
ncbi:MAG: tRNA pseudouridine(38-40) synthase TruA [Chloroflexaceae bacterium]|nr:tRNA pseudouridine(38-40) synthase TruA [Chloroflexaceae bacterium]